MKAYNKQPKAPSKAHDDSSDDELSKKMSSNGFYPTNHYGGPQMIIQNPVSQYTNLLQQQAMTPNANSRLQYMFPSPSNNHSRVTMRTKSKSSINRSKSNKSVKGPIKSALKKNVHPSQINYRNKNRELKGQVQQMEEMQQDYAEKLESLDRVINDQRQVIQNQVVVIEDLKQQLIQHQQKENTLIEQLKDQFELTKDAMFKIQELSQKLQEQQENNQIDIETVLQDKEQLKADMEIYYQNRYNDKLNLKVEQVYNEVRLNIQKQYEAQIQNFKREVQLLYDENDRLTRRLKMQSFSDKENYGFASAGSAKMDRREFSSNYSSGRHSHEQQEQSKIQIKQQALAQELQNLHQRMQGIRQLKIS